jgi:hypothetical protein
MGATNSIRHTPIQYSIIPSRATRRDNFQRPPAQNKATRSKRPAHHRATHTQSTPPTRAIPCQTTPKRPIQRTGANRSQLAHLRLCVSVSHSLHPPTRAPAQNEPRISRPSSRLADSLPPMHESARKCMVYELSTAQLITPAPLPSGLFMLHVNLPQTPADQALLALGQRGGNRLGDVGRRVNCPAALTVTVAEVRRKRNLSPARRNYLAPRNKSIIGAFCCATRWGVRTRQPGL